MAFDGSRLQVLVDVGVVISQGLVIQLIVEVKVLWHEELSTALVPVPLLAMLSVFRLMFIYTTVTFQNLSSFTITTEDAVLNNAIHQQ